MILIYLTQVLQVGQLLASISFLRCDAFYIRHIDPFFTGIHQ